MSENIFFTNNSLNSSVPVPPIPEESFKLRQSFIRPRDAVTQKPQPSFSAGYGFPGFPFEQGPANPDNFCQGADIVLDSFLYFLGYPVDKDNYTLKAVLKPSVRDISPVWLGELGYGIYPQDRQGFYTVWIPSSVTSSLTAGTYYMGIVLKEDIAAGRGPTDRTEQLLNYVFNVEYCAMSAFPENVENSHEHRAEMESPWPNTPNTVGR
jgi:hypothetical protein